jgi:hypothetical protein
MAEHLALVITRRLKALLLDATRAEGNVEIGRITPINEVDAIDIIVGPDSPTTAVGYSTTSDIDSLARFYIDLHTRTSENQERERSATSCCSQIPRSACRS